MSKPSKPHMEADLSTLGYLNHNQNQGILMSPDSSFALIAYCDLDWVACLNTRKSVSGFFILLGKTPLSWKSREQQTIALSSVETKYISMRKVCTELAM